MLEGDTGDREGSPERLVCVSGVHAKQQETLAFSVCVCVFFFWGGGRGYLIIFSQQALYLYGP